MAIVTNGRLEYEMSEIDVTYPDIGKVTYRGSYPLIVPNNWMPPSKMPVKGDIITMDGKDYRVLKIDKDIAEVLCMYDTSDQKFGNDKTYAGSDLDTYCDEVFYSALSFNMKKAIVEKTFQQDSWYFSWNEGGTSGSPKYIGSNDNTVYEVSLSSATFGTNISRRCYVISVQDIIDYIAVTSSMTSANTTLTNINIWRMFWNQSTSPGVLYTWLRSADGDFNTAFYVDGLAGNLVSSTTTELRAVRPAFQIDLSKVEYTIK